jgi:hypothetical protein
MIWINHAAFTSLAITAVERGSGSVLEVAVAGREEQDARQDATTSAGAVTG